MAIYFIRRGTNGPIKIGKADSVASRRSQLQTAHAERLHVIGVMRGDSKAERALHVAFREHSVGGEWFSPAPQILEFIAQHAKESVIAVHAHRTARQEAERQLKRLQNAWNSAFPSVKSVFLDWLKEDGK